jgi:signal transduction histidine kinase/CheY-like chemotaxis protein
MPDALATVEPLAPIDRIRGDQMRALFRSAAVALNAALVGACVLCGVLWYIDAQTPRALAGWMVFVVADYALRQGVCHLYRRRAPPAGDWRPWALGFTVATVVGGLVWGVGAVALMTPDSTEQLIVMLFISATASGAVPAFGSYLPATFAYSVPAMLPFILWSAGQADHLHHALALMGIVFTSIFLALAWGFNASLTAALLLRYENIDLLHDFKRQKDIAEQANVAKSRFLAAASHDLRQPVHALGMFISALRGRTMDEEAHRLVAHLNGSVEALDGLFGSLLDISRLDAGVVSPRLQPFAIQPLLDRVCADHAAEALAKGVRLVRHRCDLRVHSDPVLVERIVRNLVANALHYTQRGRVVVGCRRGARLSVEVWDTGPGIAPDQQARVFEEFYQLDNPERDRAKGLGLGLAIVKRLSALLECPVSMRSTVGKGSVFKLSVPLSDDAVVAPTHAAELPAPVRSGLILVVDDELAIQEGMRSLLSGWGYRVIVSGSGAQMLELVADCPTRPDLIICDYRLRGQENGIAVIRQLQSEFNFDVPAMLITGDTGPERLKEALDSGFLLLHKPVPGGRLRAAIGNLIGSTDDEASAA